MEDAQMTLPIEEELVGYRLSAGQAGQRDGPGLPLADARGYPHAIGELRQVLGNGRGWALVKVQGVLSNPPEDLEPSATLLEESGKELRVASSVGKARESEVAPLIDAPAAVAIVDHFHRRAVRPREVRMEVRASPERLHCSGILAVLSIEGDPGEGEVVVARGGAGIAVLAPVSIRRLLLGGESSHHATAQLFPLTVAEDDSRQVHGRHPERVVIGRRPDEGRLVAREVLAPRHGDGEGAHVALDLRAPPGAPLLAEVVGEQTIALEPEVNLAMVDARPRRSLRALRGKEIADAQGEPEPARIASARIGGMTRRIEHGSSEDGRREILKGRHGFQFGEAGIRLGRLESSHDGRHAGFHQAVVASGQRARWRRTPHEQDGEQRHRDPRDDPEMLKWQDSRSDEPEPSGKRQGYGAILRNVVEGTSIQRSTWARDRTEHFPHRSPREAWKEEIVTIIEEVVATS